MVSGGKGKDRPNVLKSDGGMDHPRPNFNKTGKKKSCIKTKQNHKFPSAKSPYLLSQ